MSKEGKDGLSRRQFVTTVSAGAAAGALFAPAVHAQSRKTVRMLNNETSIDTIRALRVAAAEYERATGISVTVDTAPIEDTFTKLTTSIRAGKPFDIATIPFAAHILLLAGEGHIVPLNQLTDKYKWGPKSLMPIDNKVYIYPYDYNLAWIYYRKDLYEAKGLKVPAVWSEFAANTKALNGNGMFGALFPVGAKAAPSWMSTGFMFADGVTIFDEKWNVALDAGVNLKKTASYLDLMADVYKTMPAGANQARYSETISNFVSGKVAHASYSGRMIETLERNAPDLAKKFGIFPFMASTGKTEMVSMANDGWAVTKSGNSEEAIKFLTWFTENQYINYLHSAPMHFQPARLDVYDDPRWLAHPMIEKHKDIVAEMRRFITDPKVMMTGVDTDGPNIDMRPAKVFERFIIPEMLENRCLKNMPGEECVKIASEKIRKLIAS